MTMVTYMSKGGLNVEWLVGVQACCQGRPQHQHHIQAMVKASPALEGAELSPCPPAQVCAPLSQCHVMDRHDCIVTGHVHYPNMGPQSMHMYRACTEHAHKYTCPSKSAIFASVGIAD